MSGMPTDELRFHDEYLDAFNRPSVRLVDTDGQGVQAITPDAAGTVAAVLGHMAARGYAEVEVSQQAQDAWQELLAPNPVMSSFLADCTPGYYNNEGRGPSPHSVLTGYSRGAPAYFRYIEQWRASGEFAGLEFRRPGSK